MGARKADNLFLGSVFLLLAASAYSCMGALVKFGRDISDQQLVFMRNFVCLLLLLPWILLPKPKSLKTEVLPTHLIRGSAGLLNMYCFFYSIRYILLADAMVLNNTMPLFIPLILWVWKREKIPLLLLPGLVIGFAGILFILRPGMEIFHVAALFALASGFFMSVSMAGIRELGNYEPIYRILFYYFATSTFISAFPFVLEWQNVSLLFWTLLIGVGVFAAIYQFFLTMGYQYAPASKISPLIYFAVILSGIFDWIFWGRVPDVMSYIGVVLVIAGAIWCIKVEAKKG